MNYFIWWIFGCDDLDHGSTSYWWHYYWGGF